MMKLLLFVIILFPTYTFAQNILQDSVLDFNKPEFSLSYNILIKGKNISGLAETYNGGIQTIFVKNNKVRIRLASLMRMQSIFYTETTKAKTGSAVVIKESGKKKNKLILNQQEWLNYNKTDKITSCNLDYSDTVRILNYLCKKAILIQEQNRQLEVFYVPGIKNELLSKALPLFSCIPGLILKYTYTMGGKVLEYTAATYDEKQLDPQIFTIPTQGYQLKKYIKRKTDKK